MSDIVKDSTEYRIKQIEIAEANFYRTLTETLDRIEREIVALANRDLPQTDGKLIELQAAIAIRPKIKAILDREYLAWSDTVVREGFTKQAKRVEKAFKTLESRLPAGRIPKEFVELTKGDLVLVKNLVIFTNSIGDLTAVDSNNGEIIWQTPTQVLGGSQHITLRNSEIVSDGESIFISNNNNEFFALDNWDFGEKFYFSELSTYVMKQMAPDVVTFVIVPEQVNQSFGSFYEIKSELDEIFISGATVNDIEIIDAVTASKLNSVSYTHLTLPTNREV